jgi:predicted phage terminase large subunit-like protein
MMPRFYRQERTYLKTLCDTLQAFIENKLYDEAGKLVHKLIINMPPRHGKSLTVQLLVTWALGHNPLLGTMAASYNSILSSIFAKNVRNTIQTNRTGHIIVYADIFPHVKIKAGDAAFDKWSVEGSHFSFLATSPDATATGIGGQLFVTDDIVKGAKEAFNERVLEEKRSWYFDTFTQRMEFGSKELMIATRWADSDLSGHFIKLGGWFVLKMRANINYPELPDDSTMLCPTILNAQMYLDRKSTMDDMIFSANYDQEPLDNRDKVYGTFKTYRELPEKVKHYAYVDTADEGGDYLCGIVYAVAGKLAYIEHVIYTTSAMEETEGATASMFTRYNVSTAYVESNNGGRGFARAVERIVRESGNTITRVEWFHQSENKQSRILTNATGVCNCVIMPEGWDLMWPKFYSDIVRLGRNMKWKHDDAPDALTGVYEKGIFTKRIQTVEGFRI